MAASDDYVHCGAGHYALHSSCGASVHMNCTAGKTNS